MYYIIQNKNTRETHHIKVASKDDAIAYMYKNLDMHDQWTCNQYILPDVSNIPY